VREIKTVTEKVTDEELVENLQQERDNLFEENQLLDKRPNITQTEYEKLIAGNSQLVTDLASWTNQFTNQTASEVKGDLNLALANQEKHTEQDLKPIDYDAIKEELRG